MGLFDFLFGKKKKERELQEMIREIEEAEARRKLEELLAPKKWPWEEKAELRAQARAQREKDSKVHTTGHLLFLQQFVTDAFFAYRHVTNTSKYPSYMWAEKKMFLGDGAKATYVVPFMWIRTLAKNNVPKFNEVMNLLNNEYQINVQGLGTNEMILGIKRSGFNQFQTDFDVNVNKALLAQMYRDCACLLRFINFFGDNMPMKDMLFSDRVNMASASPAINEAINEMLDAYRNGKIAK